MSILDYFNSLIKESHNSLYNELNKEISKEINKEINKLVKKKKEFNIISEVTENFFKYDKKLLDPFQDISLDVDNDNSILNHLNEWYNSINPEYKPLKALDPTIPIFNGIQPYRILILDIAKDLIILQKTKKFPNPNVPTITNNNRIKITNNQNLSKQYNLRIHYNTNNRQFYNDFYSYSLKNTTHTKNSRALKDIIINDNLETMILNLLKLINDVLDERNGNGLFYKYLEIINIIDEYLSIFSFGKKVIMHSHRDSLFHSITTPFMIYPTFNQISYTKVIYFIQAPVLNFYIMNTRKIVHGRYELPYYQLQHDISAHSRMTHSYGLDKLTDFSIFNKTNITINTFKKYINYNIKYFSKSKTKSNTNMILNNINTKKYDDNIQKFILCYILFVVCHENFALNSEKCGLKLFSSSIDEMIEMISSYYGDCNKHNTSFLNDLQETFPKYNMNVFTDINLCDKAISYLKENKTIIELEIERLNIDFDAFVKTQQIANQKRQNNKRYRAASLASSTQIRNKYYNILGISKKRINQARTQSSNRTRKTNSYV